MTTPSDAELPPSALEIARDALTEIALAGMSGSGQESEEGMRDWHARRAWDFIAIAARAKTKIDAAIAQDRAARAQAEPDAVISGALFDFLGFLTTHETRWKFSAYDDASPAVQALEQWAEKRGLMLSEADVKGWRGARAQGAGEAVAHWYELKAPMLALGQTYTTLGGERVTMAEIANVGQEYESMADQHGVHRYSRSHGRIIGRCTGSAKDDPGNIMFPLPAAPTIPQAAEVPGFVLVPREIIDRFPEINPSNYDHDDACALNAWGVELVLAAAPTPTTKAEGEAKPFGWYGESRFENDFTTNEDTSRRWHANGYRLTPLYAALTQPPSEADRTREGGDLAGSADPYGY